MLHSKLDNKCLNIIINKESAEQMQNCGYYIGSKITGYNK